MADHESANPLGQAVRIGSLDLSNRMVMGPMAANSPAEDGGPSEQTAAFFEARAKGGFGLIICGGTTATERAWAEKPVARTLRLDVEDFVPRLRQVTAAVHRHGVPIIAQLTPGFGTMGVPGPDRPTISASPRSVTIPQSEFPQGFIVPGGRTTPVSTEASLAEIALYEQEMVEAAERSARAGFDGVEVACHMSYFLSSFISPRTNWRTDEYGGTLANRARMLTNIVSGIRKRVPKDFVVGLRIPVNDYMPDGMGTAGYVDVVRHVEPFGLDFVALTAGCYETMSHSAPAADGGMIASGEAQMFRQALSVPVLFQGVHDPLRAGQAIAEGHGDLAMFARQSLADPDFPRKVIGQSAEPIVRCVRDNLCMRRMVFNMPVRCEVNPRMGREARAPGSLPPAERLFKAPVERAILGLTGSPAVMGLAGKLLGAQAK
ncbi:MAG: NADH:flavin oxidoreductase [Novosphingobium sp.]